MSSQSILLEFTLENNFTQQVELPTPIVVQSCRVTSSKLIVLQSPLFRSGQIWDFSEDPSNPKIDPSFSGISSFNTTTSHVNRVQASSFIVRLVYPDPKKISDSITALLEFNPA